MGEPALYADRPSHVHMKPGFSTTVSFTEGFNTAALQEAKALLDQL